jgi:Domain of unknown function (DUF5671)
MPHTELQPFIDAAKERGAADGFLAELLTRNGWPPADVYAGLGAWWARTTGVAVPQRRGSPENARDAFLYLLAFSTLATWASALGSLWFHLIDYWLPDPVTSLYYYNFRDSVTWQMAALLVALPIYLIVMRQIVRETRANPERVESGVRKWLTYIALLLAALAVVSDLVVFVDYFLKGGLSLRFVLKCAVVFITSGSIFWYYLGFLRGRTGSTVYTALALAGAATAFFFGLAVTGTPATQRQLEADNRRVQDLRALAGTLGALPSLPASLADATRDRPGVQVKDPETGSLYGYSVKSAKQFELCATFTAADDPGSRPSGGGFWSHPRGRACFAFEAGRTVPW